MNKNRKAWSQTILSAVLGGLIGAFLGALITVGLLVRHFPTPSTNALDIFGGLATFAGVLAGVVGVLFGAYSIWTNNQNRVADTVEARVRSSMNQLLLDSYRSTYLAERALDTSLSSQARLDFVSSAEAIKSHNTYALKRIKSLVLLDHLSSTITAETPSTDSIDEISTLSRQILKDFPNDIDALRGKATYEGLMGQRSCLITLQQCKDISPNRFSQWITMYRSFGWAMLTFADRIGMSERLQLQDILGAQFITDEWHKIVPDLSGKNITLYYMGLTKDTHYESTFLYSYNFSCHMWIRWNGNSYGEFIEHSLGELPDVLTGHYRIALYTGSRLHGLEDPIG